MKKFISVLTVVLVLITSTVFARDYAQRFWDVPKDYWGFEYIADLTERGVIKGYEDGSFKPENIVLRSEWAKMMVTAAGLSVNDNGTYFTDTNGHWANSYINTAKNYLTGYSDGSYRPDQAATREDVTVAMVKLKGYDLSDVDYSYLNTFRDVDSISNYAKGYVAVAIKNNLISGFEDNTFRGQDTLTRAEAATLMYRAFKHGNADKVTTTPTTPITSDTSKSNEDYAKQAEFQHYHRGFPHIYEAEAFEIQCSYSRHAYHQRIIANILLRYIYAFADTSPSNSLSKLYVISTFFPL